MLLVALSLRMCCSLVCRARRYTSLPAASLDHPTTKDANQETFSFPFHSFSALYWCHHSPGDSDHSARHHSDQAVFDCKEGGMRTAVAEGNAKPLGAAQRDIDTELSRRSQHAESEQMLYSCLFSQSKRIRSTRCKAIKGRSPIIVLNVHSSSNLRKTLELHSQMGHSTCESKPTHQHIIRCPFCLYHSKNKNNMIDHIVLHREERVLPVELNRPKLSRYLRGTVFRCHKCTFSSGSAETLRLHMLKHGGGIQPYRCRLCYFDCSQMAELEAHLSDKHQVLRNHQLVSQVDACIPNDKQAENKESVSDRDEIPQNDLMAEYGARDTMFLPIEEAHVKQEREEETSVSDVQPDDAQPQKKRQQDSPAADVHVAFALSAEGEGKSMHERLGGLEEEENPARLTGQLKEEAEEAQVDGLGFQELQQKGQISEATSEDDAERGALPQEEDGSRSHDWEDRKPTIKIEKVETVCADQDLRDEEGSAACSPNPTTNSVSANKFDWKSHVGAGLESCEPEPKQTPSDWKDTIEPRGEVPAPETERHEEQQQEETELLAQKQDAKDETRCKEQDIPNMCDADEAAGVPRVDKPFTCHFCGRNLTNAAELKRHVKRHGL
uniref:C2H2-type domain-containing protein n=1 Tax=Nothobranchius furzeri TaxID=105023 RepID=A0A8C6Q2Z5_NOTFU